MRDLQSVPKPNRPCLENSDLLRAAETTICLPGEHVIVPRLVTKAVEDLNGIHRSFALHYCLEMGGYILDTFFSGKSKQFARSARGHLSFRALAASGELNFSASYLYTSVAVAAQYCQLPAEVADELPLSHHRLLLSVSDARVKRRLAGQALEAGLSKRQLADAVREYRARAAGPPGPGRPAHPPALKHLIRLDEVVQALVATPESELEIEDRFRERVQDLAGKIREDLRMLEARLDQLDGGTSELT